MINHEVDKTILELLAARRMFFGELCAEIPVPERQIDRRLQALRKKGAVAFDSKAGWSVK